MRRPSAVAALSLPGTNGWDFGDYPYGLEPLTMPAPNSAAPDGGSRDEADLDDACLGFLARAKEGFGITPPVDDSRLGQLFWFRWIIGHHVSFVIWRLLADELSRLSSNPKDREAASVAVTEYVRAYCGMLLYTGSCNSAIYNADIRPSMHRLHSTFSGTWAPDYPPVRSLFRGRKLPPVVASERERLVRQVELSHRIHLGVAAKLVEGGRSLLQQSVAQRDANQPRMWEGIFDCYFLTLRAPTTRQEILAQLLRRNKAIVMDLATNGLYPGSPESRDETLAEMRHPDIVECEEDLPPSLFRVAGLAAGFSAARVAKEMTAS
ncbi:hypothetical protein ACFRCG_35265 [Embleya sp. NPDC056575]|uniref:hypothetical protein n=1 Tax=unclassified Embleya TaxID=2699296 RepID=UPI0036A0D1D8